MTEQADMTERRPAGAGVDPGPGHVGSGELNGALADRLAELKAVTVLLPELPGRQIRGHVAGVRSFLHDDVLRHAHAEELALFPVFARLGRDGERMRAGLVVEHDTIRHAAGALDDLAARPLTTASVRSLAGVLDSIELLLDGHLRHESDASLALLDQLEAEEQLRLRAQLAALDAPVTTTPPAWWLPERLPPASVPGSADLLEPERLVGASCDPGVFAIVRSAIAAFTDSLDERGWRTTLREHSRYRLHVPDAEACMRDAGIWPWAGPVRPESSTRTTREEAR